MCMVRIYYNMADLDKRDKYKESKKDARYEGGKGNKSRDKIQPSHAHRTITTAQAAWDAGEYEAPWLGPRAP
jgi:hypothetical protein